MASRLLLAASLLSGAGAVLLSNVTAPECECLNWKKTYEAKKAVCGQANELFFMGNTQHEENYSALLPMWGERICDKLFTALDDNFCVNVNMGKDDGTWCYVDSACSDGTAMEGGDVGWKMCEVGADRSLRDFTPKQVDNLAHSSKPTLDLAFLTKLSYPANRQYMWKQVASFYNLKDLDSHDQATFPGFGKVVRGISASREPLHEGKRRVMQWILESQEAVLFETQETMAAPYVIVKGWQVFVVLDKLYCINACDQ